MPSTNWSDLQSSLVDSLNVLIQASSNSFTHIDQSISHPREMMNVSQRPDFQNAVTLAHDASQHYMLTHFLMRMYEKNVFDDVQVAIVAQQPSFAANRVDVQNGTTFDLGTNLSFKEHDADVVWTHHLQHVATRYCELQTPDAMRLLSAKRAEDCTVASRLIGHIYDHFDEDSLHLYEHESAFYTASMIHFLIGNNTSLNQAFMESALTVPADFFTFYNFAETQPFIAVPNDAQNQKIATWCARQFVTPTLTVKRAMDDMIPGQLPPPSLN